MRLHSLSKTLLILGVVIGSAAGIALALGLRAEDIPSWMITVGMYKLAFIGAAGLFVAGALVGRAARRKSVERHVTHAPELGEGPMEPPVRADGIEARHRRPGASDR